MRLLLNDFGTIAGEATLIRRFTGIVLAICTSVVLLAMGSSQRALAAPASQLEFPFAVGEKADLLQGPHTNNADVCNYPTSGAPCNALDLVPASGLVRAARAGTAHTFSSCQNLVMVDHQDGWITGYYHLIGITVTNGQPVQAGDELGQISMATGCGGSASTPHVHFFVKYSPTGWAGLGDPFQNTGIDQDLQGFIIGGWQISGRQWSSCATYPVTGERECAPAGNVTNYPKAALPLNTRLAVQTTGGEFFAKEGSLYAGWLDEYGPAVGSSAVTSVKVSGDLIGVLTNSGELFVKQGSLYAGWVDEYGPNTGTAPVSSATLFGDPYGNTANDFIGVLTTGGEFLAKRGSLYSGWVDEYGPAVGLPAVASGMISGDLIGVLTNSGELLVKQGGLHAGWVDEYGPNVRTPAVANASLYGDIASNDTWNSASDLIGLVTTGGEFLAKQAGLYAGWVDEYGPAVGLPAATTGLLSGELIGVVTNPGELLVKQGSLYAGWVDEYGPAVGLPALRSGVFPPVASIQGYTADKTADLISVVNVKGEALAKQGLNGGWVDEYGPAVGAAAVSTVAIW